jgi:hypothetical protein
MARQRKRSRQACAVLASDARHTVQSWSRRVVRADIEHSGSTSSSIDAPMRRD